MILGNKCDMESKRQITTERGQRLAEDYGVKFFETSARDSVNVEAAFYEFAKAIKAKEDKINLDNQNAGSKKGGKNLEMKYPPGNKTNANFFRNLCNIL